MSNNRRSLLIGAIALAISAAAFGVAHNLEVPPTSLALGGVTHSSSALKIVALLALPVQAQEVELVQTQEIEYKSDPMPSYTVVPSIKWSNISPRLMAVVTTAGKVEIDWNVVDEVLQNPDSDQQTLMYARVLKAARQGTWQQFP